MMEEGASPPLEMPPPPPPPPSLPPPPPPACSPPGPPPLSSVAGSSSTVPASAAIGGGGADGRQSAPSSGFSSPLPPCPEDPPGPPPPSCTPPQYNPLEEEENETEDEHGDDDESEVPSDLVVVGDGDEPPPLPPPPQQLQTFSTPPPPPSPPSASPVAPGTPPPPPPPPYSPPSVKIDLGLQDALQQDSAQQDTQTDTAEGESSSKDANGETDPATPTTPNLSLSSSSSSVIASMRSAASECEIMAADMPREPAVERPRWYLGDIESYSIIDKVGSGTYGEVFKCQHKITKDIVALKKLRPDVEKNGFPVTSIREMKILKMLKHPNVLSLKEIVSSSAPPKEGKRPLLYFAFEYMEHDLSGLLNHPRVKFSRTQIQCYMRQLLCGVAFMHRNKILHRDIKASNLLLNNSGLLKVADFGLSRFWNEVNAKAGRYTNKVVTLWYRPPELLMGSTSYDFSVDVWSIGCIFAELLTGKPILQGKTEIEQLQLIFGLCGLPTQETWPGFFDLPGAADIKVEEKYVCRMRDRFKNIPPVALDLLEKLMTLDPAKRITAAEAMDHDYFWRVQTCKPRDLPKFCVSSTHGYQNKKRPHEEAAAGSNAGAPPAQDPHRRHRETRPFRDRNDPYRQPGAPDRSHHGPPPAAHGGRPRPYARHRDSDYYDRDRDRDRDRHRDRERNWDRDGAGGNTYHGSRDRRQEDHRPAQ